MLSLTFDCAEEPPPLSRFFHYNDINIIRGQTFCDTEKTRKVEEGTTAVVGKRNDVTTNRDTIK